MIVADIKWKCPKCKQAVVTPKDDVMGPFIVARHTCGFEGYFSQIKHEEKARGTKQAQGKCGR